MKRFISLTIILIQTFTLNANEAVSSAPTSVHSASQMITFVPPTGWRQVDKSKLTPNVLAMVVGKGSREFPPSINLAVHRESGTLKEFLRFVKQVNEADGIEWKDLGLIRTQSGDAALSQLDARTEWGVVREMQVILIHENDAYILTAASLKDEFSKFYKEFFASLRSLKLTK